MSERQVATPAVRILQFPDLAARLTGPAERPAGAFDAPPAAGGTSFFVRDSRA